MRGGLRETYGRIRTLPVVGVLASRLVWAAKGALGRPLSLPTGAHASTPPRTEAPAPPAPDIRLRAALVAAQALLDARPAEAPGPRPRPSGGAPRRISVVICTLDRASWLDRALTALAYQRHAELEVIVVAGPCRDDTDAVLARHALRIEAARCAVANLSAARNIGLGLATGEVVAFLDDDAVPEPDWLERLALPYADPAVGGVGGYIRDHTGVGFQCRLVVADRFGASEPRDGPAGPELDAVGPAVERYLSLTGTNCSFRRDALAEIGGFDEAFAYFLDETDVCLRLAEAGWRLAVAPQAEVHHAYAPSAERRADGAPRRLYPCVRSTAYFAMRHAARRHGVAAVAERLHDYAQVLRADTRWRVAHEVIGRGEAMRMLGEIEQGVADGVRAAWVGAPRPPAAAADAPLRRPRPGPRRPPAERLRLCLLSQAYPADAPGRPAGGIAVWTQALAQTLAAEGHEVSVITRGETHSVAFEANASGGLWLHHVPARPARPPLRTPDPLAGAPRSVRDPSLAAAEEVARIAPRRAFDLVMGPLWDLEPAALLPSAPCPVAVSLHTACAQMAAFKPEWSAGYRASHVDRVIAGERRLLRAAPHLLSNSRATVRDLAAALDLPDLQDRATVVPHGLPDLAQGVRAASRDSGVEILFVGRLEPRKGIDVLLRAAAAVLQGAPSARLVIVGEDVCDAGAPPWRERFGRESAGAAWARRVRFEGPLPRSDLLARYAAADVVAAPSRYESFGLTALEAMIFGKPVVASAVGGLPEVVAAGETGLLAPPGDPDALAAALLTLVGDGGLRAAMGQAGRRRYEACFTARSMAAAVEDWAWGVCGRARRLAAE